MRILWAQQLEPLRNNPIRAYALHPTADKATLVATTEETQSPLPVRQLPASDFIKVDVSAIGGPDAWAKPISVYFRRNAGFSTLVGLERLP